MDREQELMCLLEELHTINEEIEGFELDLDDFEDEYDELLNGDGPVVVVGLEYEAAQVLQKVDPTAYRCGLIDFVDGIDVEDVPEYQELEDRKADVEYRIEELQEDE